MCACKRKLSDIYSLLPSQLLPTRKTWTGEDVPLSYDQAVSSRIRILPYICFEITKYDVLMYIRFLRATGPSVYSCILRCAQRRRCRRRILRRSARLCCSYCAAMATSGYPVWTALWGLESPPTSTLAGLTQVGLG